MIRDSTIRPRRRARAPALLFITAALLAAMAAGPAVADLLGDGAAAYQAGDYGEAANAWRPLAEGGDAMAQFNLGLLYETGRGVAEDAAQAAAWYERAALQGVTRAQFNLALLHQTGRGVEKDGGQALYWLEVAARHGEGAEQEQAADAAARLAEILPAEDADDARVRAGVFAVHLEEVPAREAAITLILSESQVEELQRRLAAHGYEPGPADGIPGEKTRSAVRRYLADRGLEWPQGENLSQRLLDLVRAP
ncbi:MAG: SEL1-like repeat protein [Rhodospirillales bacterium]|nr:SEL1-like repeat protein [Rhodospirillales bacterium]